MSQADPAQACSEPGSAQALQLAKENLLRHYLVVGYVENMKALIEVLELTLPRFFRNALRHFEGLDGGFMEWEGK